MPKVIRGSLIFLLSIIFLLFIRPIFGGTLHIGIVFGSTLTLLFLFIVIFYNKIKTLLKSLRKNKVIKLITNIILIIFLLLVIFAIVLSSFMVSRINVKPQNDTTVIILGCRVRGDNPSLMLINRVRSSVKYLKENPENPVIVSGGQGAGENISEAQCMKNLLIEYGIDENRIYIEDKSTSTEENLKFSKNIIEDNGFNKNITIVTSEYHQLRSYLFAKDVYDDVYSISSSTTITYFFPSWVREWFAICHKIVFNGGL